MTEAEWISGWRGLPNIRKMANEIVTVASKRKLRLLACACCYRLRDSLSPAAREYLLLADKHADRKANPKALPSNKGALPVDRFSRAVHLAAYRHDNAELLIEAVRIARSAKAALLPEGEYGEAEAEEAVAQLELVQDIFGPLPFRSNTLDLAFLTPTVKRLAESIYQERAFDSLPILADALEESGCDNADILAHCRGPGPHVRGCWVIDLLTERE